MDATKELLAAARVGDAARVARSLRRGADANATDWMQQTPLFLAAKDGHVGVARALLDAGANPDARDNYGSTPLMLAADKGAVDLVVLLLSFKANVNHATHDGDTLLMTAALRGHVRVVTALLDAGANADAANRWGATALHVAALHGHVDAVRALLEAGADGSARNAGGKTPLDEAERKHHTAVAQLLRQFDGAGALFLQAVRRGDVDGVRRGLTNPAVLRLRGPNERTPVHIAAKYGRLEVLRLLLSRGAGLTDRDDMLWTPLHHACEHGDVEIVRFLLTQRADPSCVDGHGRSPIDIAALNGRLDVVRELCRLGASLTNVSLDDRTILHRAVTSKNVELIDFIVTQRVDINASDTCGWTALHQAVSTGLSPVVKKLLALGADANILTTANRTDKTISEAESALHLAIRGDHTRIVSALVAHHGINLDIGNHLGRTPLVFAASLDRVKAADILIKAGANVNAQGNGGESALLVASVRGLTETVHALLKTGARTDLAAKSGNSPLSGAKTPEIREVIQLYHNSQQYHETCFRYLNSPNEPPTIAKLKDLVPLLTSVYDLRHMLTLVAMCDDSSDTVARRDLMNAAFHHVVDNKLTFDDDACVFFKLSLERCEQDKLLARGDILLLDRKAEKVNTESADWVIEMKKQVSTSSWRLDAHDQYLNAVVNGIKEVHSMVMQNRKAIGKVSRRVGGLQQQVNNGKKLLMQLGGRVDLMSTDMARFESRLSQSEENIQTVASSLQSFRQAYVGRLEQEERNKKIKRVCGIVASVAGFVLAPVLKEVTDAVVDFINPVDIVEKIYGEVDIAGFLSDSTEKHLPEIIQEQLEKYAIPIDEFEALLKEEIVLQHPEYAEVCTRRGLTMNVDGGQSDVALSVEPTLDAEEVTVLQIVGELQHLCASASNSATKPSERPNIVPSARSLEVDTPSPVEAVTAELERVQVEETQPTPASEPIKQAKTETPKPVAPPKQSASNESNVSASGDVGEVAFVDDIDDFHYHAAVQESRGNLVEFTELAEMIDSDPHATMTMQLKAVTKSQEALCAATFAYRQGYRSIGDFLVSQMNHPHPMDTTPATSVELLDDAEEFPFVFAVEESEGDFEECKHLVLSLFELMDDDDHALDATIDAMVVRETAETVQWSALEYACHLGYQDIVKYMLKEIYKDSVSLKQKFQLLKTVRERSALLNAP